jgi:glycosyltransferase involved in cell wall biosynthesis
MSETKSFIFISIDGMTDPLGQSQVLPYLQGLSKKGNKVTIVSYEKKENWDLHHKTIESIVNAAQIDWHYCFYKTGMPFVSQLQNYIAIKKIVTSLVLNNLNICGKGHTILHCRSYLAGLIGLNCKKKYGTGFIFDMRGFWADERIEGNIWSKSNPIGSFLYSYFKKKEKEMLVRSDAIISLTHRAKAIILNWGLEIADAKVTVIPCCADLNFFSKASIDNNKLISFQNKYPQLSGKFVLSYLGSLGTWYMANEMLAFFKQLSQKTDCHFLVITKDREELVHSAAKKHGVSLDQLTVVSSSRADMPYLISLSTASIFFIRPSFSKSASSPTKMGELLSMQVPLITNAGVGDVDSIIQQTQCGVIVADFTQKEYQQAVLNLIENRNLYLSNTVSAANQYFSLKEGVEKYASVYNSFSKN